MRWVLIAALASSCSSHVYCWRNTESDPPHCYDSAESCEMARMTRTAEQIRDQIARGAPIPECTEEVR